MLVEENLLEIALGTVCSMGNSQSQSQEYIKEFIEKLGNRQGEEMKINQTSKEFSIHCSNQPREICPFHFTFTKKIDVESKEVGLELKDKHIQHSETCKIQNEEESFERNHRLIVESKQVAVNIILSRYPQYGPQNPKKILQIVSEALGYNGVFINRGLQTLELKRRLKKKFDNLVAEIRKEYNLTPTKLHNDRKIKKTKAKFRLFRQKQSQNFNNSQENDALMIQAEDNDDIYEEDNDDQSDFYPSQNLKRLRNEKLKISTKQKDVVRQQAFTVDKNSHSCPSKTQSSLIGEVRRTKRKIIKKQW